jgi:hypothetical protein
MVAAVKGIVVAGFAPTAADGGTWDGAELGTDGP